MSPNSPISSLFTMFAAIDTGNPTGAVYGVGNTPEAAKSDARKGVGVGGGDAEFAVVPCTQAAADYVERHGGTPLRGVVVTKRNVYLLTEEISDAHIEALRAEAGAAGDIDQVALCDKALQGDSGARLECDRVILAGRG